MGLNLAINAVVGGFASFGVMSSFSIFAIQLRMGKELENTPKNRALQKRVQKLADRLELGKPVEVRFRGDYGQASGNTLLPGRAGFIIGKEFLELPRNEQEFIILHELAHLKHNDMLKGGALYSLAVAVTICVIPLLTTSIIIISSAPATAGLVAFFAYSKYFEKRADITAFAHCSPEGKAGGIAFFQKLRIKLLCVRSDSEAGIVRKVLRKLLISDSGDFRLDVVHPSFSERVKYLTELSPVKPKVAKAKKKNLRPCHA